MRRLEATGKKRRPPSLPLTPLKSHTEPFGAAERTGTLEAGSAWFKFSLAVVPV